ncbi:MAG: peptide ABC transporter ATP-binding protein [Spirochaetae bacterium HGW-Spirochaetae-1]|jgi:oligopeptide/dipeptide ABC transporter ATP-binding protein|nr:MAG: peptide ABC transporter ATP-binding protein [Spirochaetae bacterium HGW-Spirochaetae-1]
MSNAIDTLLQVRNLGVTFHLSEREVMAVRDVSFSLARGETLGLVGESGCGKSVTAFSILRLVSPPGEIISGEVIYGGRNIVAMTSEEVRSIRGKDIAMIFQEPMTSLNPVFSIGFQISESIMLHSGAAKKDARDLTIEMLGLVGIPNAEKRFDSYPHEFSGGMRQRVMIAMALSASPSVLIADEPTTALDVTIQAQILDLLLEIQQKKNMSLLLITHDLGIVANIADNIAIMYAGEIVETGKTGDIFSNPGHPYTRGLFEAIPRVGETRDRLRTIPGIVPTISSIPQGCVFYPRCHLRTEECLSDAVVLREISPGHSVRCIKA